MGVQVLRYRQDPPEVSTLSGQASALSRPLQPSIRFLRHPLPPQSSPLLALGLPCLHMGLVGLTTFRSIDNYVPLRGFLSPGHATNDEMAMRQRHFLMAHLLVTALRNLADRWQLLAPF